jgi:hypothetical protein
MQHKMTQNHVAWLRHIYHSVEFSNEQILHPEKFADKVTTVQPEVVDLWKWKMIVPVGKHFAITPYGKTFL